MVEWFNNLSEGWQTAIFTAGVAVALAVIGGLFKWLMGKKDGPAAPRAAHIENPDTTSVPATPDQLPNGAPFPADMQESFVKVWRLLASLEKDGENLWQHISYQTLSVFADRLREVKKCIAESALFFTEEDYGALQEILRAADFYLNGKVKLSDIRNGKIDSDILLDLAGPEERNRFVDNAVQKQIRQNKRWLTRYRNLLNKIRSSFHETILMPKNKPKISIGDVNGDVIISQNQSGGTTAHGARTVTDKKPSKSKWSIITVIFVVAAIITILTYFGIKPIKENKMPKDEEEKISIGDVNGDVVISQNQSGGITAGKIGQINILTDKESLGIREPEGLYQNGKKVGRVVNFVANEKEAIFTMTSIEFDQPLRDSGVVWQPYEYQNYTIQIKGINSLVMMMPPGAEGVSGVILNKK